ncbi:MAG: bifunctional hydroxymethylpyrimidine kinase/phosphomethylpyrimidine kinase [Candidatus Eisenbacteria bacterium]|nr:bifunctional hydroxymethylpyrimidine kinase/phosphomethylpyrimidine kinase [Candidatus Eisenbacteria bacterium]
MNIVLTIGGSDPSSGAGIQSDIKTFQSLGTYGVSVITAITSQNASSFMDFVPVGRKVIRSQFQSVISGFSLSAAKTGMLGTAEIIEEIAELLHGDPAFPLVIDPVIFSGTGARLLDEKALYPLKKLLVPISSLVSPNLHEAAILSGREVSDRRQMADAAKAIFDLGAKAVVVKGGHLEDDAVDIFFDGRMVVPLTGKRVPVKNVHGTGCVFSAAAASFLASGDDTLSSVKKAKKFALRTIIGSFESGTGARLPAHPIGHQR